MKAITKLVAIIATTLAFNASAAPMSTHMENALVDICKASITKSLGQFNKTVRSYNLDTKKVAKGVVCNGDDIADFAEKYGATKIADRLNRSVGVVTISELARNNK